jgi:phage shock protein C
VIKRLYREPEEAKLAGVCAGLGTYFEIDPVILRVAWLLATVFTGFVFGIVAYLVAWIVVPQRPAHSARGTPAA